MWATDKLADQAMRLLSGREWALGGTLFYWMAIAAALLHDVGKATPIF